MGSKTISTKLAVLAAMMLLCCSMVLINSNARAQCPDSTGPAPNPDSVAWNQDSAYFPLPGTNCFVTTYYCYRLVYDTVQIYMGEIVPDSSLDCDSLSWTQIIDGTRDSVAAVVLTNDFPGLTQPCFKSEFVFTQTYEPYCWQMSEIVGGGGPGHASSTGVFPCALPPYNCVKTCKACWDPVLMEVVVEDCTLNNVLVETDCGPPAPPGGPTLWPPWTLNTCYTFGCTIFNPLIIEHLLKVELSTTTGDKMQMYPNPASEIVIITSPDAGQQVQILDVLGREVASGVIPANGPLTMDVSKLPNGPYYVCEGRTEVRFVKR